MANDFAELDVVALRKDVSQDQLPAGQTGTVVFVHRGGEAMEVEFILEGGRSVVTTLLPHQLLKLRGLGYTRAAG